MRIAIPTLPSADSIALKTMLEQAGYLIVTEFPSYTVRVERGTHPWIVVDVPDAIFGRLLTHRIGDIAPWNGVFVRAKDGNQNDKAAILEVPDNDPKALEAVCVGTMRALDQIQKITTEPAKVAGTPFLNASELLANAVDVLSARISEASTTATEQLTQVITGSQTATAVTISQASVTASDSMDASLAALRSDVARLHVTVAIERRALFGDLITYYTRPRWWQRRYWQK